MLRDREPKRLAAVNDEASEFPSNDSADKGYLRHKESIDYFE